tara:strand:+ start:284 stop:547 length:264 start_codon:yes stop_codon:yes gene_type:complete
LKKKDKDNDKGWYDSYFINDYKYGPKKKPRSGHTWSKNKTDDILSFCETCRLVWEIEINTTRVAYYEDFPSIGKNRKECPQCKNQKA